LQGIDVAGLITCQEFVELTTDYLEDTLDPATRRRFEEHLALCPGCETYLGQLRETARVTGRLEEKHLSEPARTTLMNAFREWKTVHLRGSPAIRCGPVIFPPLTCCLLRLTWLLNTPRINRHPSS
jgi:hypothetical protein